MSRIFEYFVVCGIGPEIRTYDGSKGYHGTGVMYLPSLLDQYPPPNHTLYPPPPPQLPTVSTSAFSNNNNEDLFLCLRFFFFLHSICNFEVLVCVITLLYCLLVPSWSNHVSDRCFSVCSTGWCWIPFLGIWFQWSFHVSAELSDCFDRYACVQPLAL